MITFAQRVLNAQFHLNETDEQIIEYINIHRAAVAHLSIGKLAAATFVAPNTITRLCHKLSYDGFVALKLALRELDSGPSTEKQREILNRNFDLIDSQRERSVVDRLRQSKRVLFFAVGETAYVAHNFAYLFNAVDNKSQFVTYENQIIYEIKNLESVSIICISQSGETSQVLRVAKVAKANHQFIISLTGLHENTLAKMADIPLYSYAPSQEWHGFNFTDKTPLYIVMNSLFTRYYSDPV